MDRVQEAWWPEVAGGGGTGAPLGSGMPPDGRREHWQARHRARARTAWHLQRRAPAADRGVAELQFLEKRLASLLESKWHNLLNFYENKTNKKKMNNKWRHRNRKSISF